MRTLMFCSWSAAVMLLVSLSQAQEAPPGGTEVPIHNGSVAVDPLGFALFGPTVNAEARVGAVGLGLGFRWLSPGILANSLFLDEGDSFGFSYGLAARGQYYLAEPLSGPHIGFAVEYLRTRIENESSQIATLSSYVVPQIEAGYRFAWPRFFVGGVAALGYAAQVADDVENINGGMSASLYEVEDESSVYGTARLDIGVLF